MPKTVGILGGMGPYAALDFAREVLRFTPASRECDHIPTIIYNNPSIPSRTRAFLYGESDPVPFMRQAVQGLVAAGAEIIAVPCNSAHYFLPEVMADVSTPYIDMIQEVKKTVLGRGWGRVGVLAGEVTVHARLYDHALGEIGVRVDHVCPDRQILVRKVIEAVKLDYNSEAEINLMIELLNSLSEAGVDGVILGCTELQASMPSSELPVPVIDSVRTLALSVVSAAT